MQEQQQRQSRLRDGYPAGVPCWVDTSQPDPEAATRFYGPLFGWEFEDRMPPDAPGHFFAASLNGGEVAAVGSVPEGTPPLATWNTYVAVDSADETAAAAKAAGGTVLSEPFDVFAAGRMAVLADPSGAVFSVWQAGEHRGAELVNAPGTWNFSDLNTRDVAGAKAFYGAVFGWRAVDVDFGGEIGSGTMWTLPGYGDELEKIDPGIKQRHKDFEAPEGFTDAVAWLNDMTQGGQFGDDVAPHWSISFAVDGTDEVAAHAEELGGTVLVPPFDAGPTRIAVIRDPQGAVFSIATFSPE